MKRIAGIALLLLIHSFSMPLQALDYPIDKKATKETIALYRNLRKLLHKGIMFGHQDDLAYGVGWKYEQGNSDVKLVTGDYPAVYGWELGNLEHRMDKNIDGVPFDKMREFIQQGYRRGGVITISWHNDNPLTGGTAWDTTHGAVQAVLPGGSRHEMYKNWLDQLAEFFLSLKGDRNELIPVLFRPYHELTGNWFWWCRNTNTADEFKMLWRFTVEYLCSTKEVHNLLYVYNTADFSSREEFLDRYPGDDMTDLVSFDAYHYGGPDDPAFPRKLNNQLTILTALAGEKNKIPALGETGYEAIPHPKWWTEVLWKAISPFRISYVLLWRNHGKQASGNMHYYVPFRGDRSEKDFVKFYNLKRTLFEKEAARARLYQ